MFEQRNCFKGTTFTLDGCFIREVFYRQVLAPLKMYEFGLFFEGMKFKLQGGLLHSYKHYQVVPYLSTCTFNANHLN